MQSKYDPSNLPKIRILLLCTNSTAQANIPICVRVQELYIVFVVGRFSDLVILLQDRVHVTWCHEKLLVSRRQQRMHSEKKNKFFFSFTLHFMFFLNQRVETWPVQQSFLDVQCETYFPTIWHYEIKQLLKAEQTDLDKADFMSPELIQPGKLNCY